MRRTFLLLTTPRSRNSRHAISETTSPPQALLLSGVRSGKGPAHGGAKDEAHPLKGKAPNRVGHTTEGAISRPALTPACSRWPGWAALSGASTPPSIALISDGSKPPARGLKAAKEWAVR
jgi:hypothetical protein